MSVLVFYGFFITAFSHISADARFVDENGTNIPIQNETLCYGDNYNLRCNGGAFAPIENTFGLKTPIFSRHHNCSQGHFPYPRDCCVKDSTDCTFPSIKGFSKLRGACSGRNVCNGTTATNHPVYRNYPKMNEDSCPGQSNINGTGALETQYVTTKYACIPLITMSTICNPSVHTGKGLFVVSPDYPASPRYKFGVSGYTCACHANVTSGVTLTVTALDLRLCKNKGKECGKSLTLGEKVVNYTYTQEVYGGMFGIAGLQTLYSEVPENMTMDITLETMDYKDEVYMWIYLYANGSDIRLVCDPLSLVASPIIQTTTPAITATTATTINLTTNQTSAIPSPIATRRSVTVVPRPITILPILSTASNLTSFVRSLTTHVPYRTNRSITTIADPKSAVQNKTTKGIRLSAAMNPTITTHWKTVPISTILSTLLETKATKQTPSTRSSTEITTNLNTAVTNATSSKTPTAVRNPTSPAPKMATTKEVATTKFPTFPSTSKLSIGKRNTLPTTIKSQSTVPPVPATSPQMPSANDSRNVGLVVGPSVAGGIVIVIIVVIIIVCVVKNRRRNNGPASDNQLLNTDTTTDPADRMTTTFNKYRCSSSRENQISNSSELQIPLETNDANSQESSVPIKRHQVDENWLLQEKKESQLT